MKPARPGDAMLHPAILAALALLVVNDHVLKGAAAGTPFDVVTGKLSDFAGLAFFPALLFSLVELVTRRAPASLRVVIACTAATEVVFALTKTWAPAADVYRLAVSALQWPVLALVAVADGRAAPGLGGVRHVVDPTDLVALPAAAVALLVGLKRARPPGPPTVGVAQASLPSDTSGMRFLVLALVLPAFACGPEEVSLEGADMTATVIAGKVTLDFDGFETEGGCPAIAFDGVTYNGGDFELLSDCELGTVGIELFTSPTDPASDGELVIESGGGTVRWVATNLLAARGFVRIDGFEQVPRGAAMRLHFDPATDLLAEPTLVELRDGPDQVLPLEFRLDREPGAEDVEPRDAITIFVPVDAEGGVQTLAVSAPFEVPTATCEGFASCAANGIQSEELEVAIAP